MRLLYTSVLLVCFSCALQAQNGGKFSFEKSDFHAVEGKAEKVVVIRSGNPEQPASVRVRSVAASAQADKDFAPMDTQVTFAAGESEKTIAVAIKKDAGVEFPETLYLELSEPSSGYVVEGISKSRIQIVMFGSDGVVVGLIFAILALIFATSSSKHPGWQKFYRYVPALLLCYFLPSVLSTFGIISGHYSQLYYVASRYLLPACLVLLCLSLDLPGIKRLGPKAIIMFLTGTAGIVLGGPLALLLVSWVSPETVFAGEAPNEVWRGMTTVAGSWIGGGANQAAMKELFEVGGLIFSATVTVDIIVANLWMAVLLFLVGEEDRVNEKILKADNSAVESLKQRMADYQEQIARIPNLTDVMKFLGAAFFITAIGHFVGDVLAPILGKYKAMVDIGLNKHFFWLVVVASVGGLTLSFTKAREWEGAGASRIGSAFLYVLVASIGMHMDLLAIFRQPGLFVVGAIWILFHGVLLFGVARLIRAPFFLLAVGSQANVGGAASAPVVASAFHPVLAPIGVMLAVLGYFLGTFAAMACGLMMQALLT